MALKIKLNRAWIIFIVCVIVALMPSCVIFGASKQKLEDNPNLTAVKPGVMCLEIFSNVVVSANIVSTPKARKGGSSSSLIEIYNIYDHNLSYSININPILSLSNLSYNKLLELTNMMFIFQKNEGLLQQWQLEFIEMNLSFPKNITEGNFIFNLSVTDNDKHTTYIAKNIYVTVNEYDSIFVTEETLSEEKLCKDQGRKSMRD